MSRSLTYRAAAGEALREALARDERVVVLGQDIGARGGAFGVTAGLLEEFGAARVRDAPSAEAALVGVGIGAAMAGMRPVVELTTAAFAALAFDQIAHHAAPLRALSGGRLSAPLVLRMPQGGGARLGPIHSEMVEALLHHIPGLVVATPATPADAKGLLSAAIASDDPVVVLEHTALYDVVGVVDDDVPVAPLGHAVVRRAGRDVTLVAGSRMARVAEEAAGVLAEQHGISAEVVDLRTVRPLDHATIAASVRRTRHAVLIEEGRPDGGVGATLAARIATAAPGRPLARVTGADIPMPYARILERLAVPDADAVVEATLTLLARDARPAAPERTASAVIDMEALLAVGRGGATLASAIVTAIEPLVPDGETAILLADGTLTLLGTAGGGPRAPRTTLTFSAITTRPTVHAGAVTVHHTATLTVRSAGEAGPLLAALRAALEAA